MLQDTPAFSGFSVNDLDVATKFYREILGLKVTEHEMGIIALDFPNGLNVMVYPKDNHEPATFTVLNFPVQDVEAVVDELAAKGVKFEQYSGDIETDEKGISRQYGQVIAWFKDPAGNIMSVLNADQ